MEIIRSELGLDPKSFLTDERLMEAAYGKFEGVTIFEMEENHPDIFARRKADRWHFQPPEGESLQMTLERVAPFFGLLSKPCIITAHGAVGRTVRKHLLQLSEQDAGWYEFPQDRVFRIEMGEETLI